jgi:hypothetical protein
MADRILYVVAPSREDAERSLLHRQHNPYIMTRPDVAEKRAEEQTEMWGGKYSVFKAKVTVEMLED